MRKFTISIDIDAPVERVVEVMKDTGRWQEWTPSVTSITPVGGGPIVVGSRVMIRQPKFPPALWKVIALEPTSFTWVSTAPGLRMVAHHFVEKTPTGSRVTLSLDMQGLLGGLFARLTKDITERYIAFEANGLKARSENPDYRHSH